MLNIGKPFHIEGIGTLQKNKDGVYEFTPGQPAVQRLESPSPVISPDREADKPAKKKSVFDENPYEARNASTRRLAIILGLVVGLGIILWGGYSLFSSKVDHSGVAANSTEPVNPEDTAARTSQYLHNIDTPQKALAAVIQKDSTHLNKNNQAETTKTAASSATQPVTAANTAAGPSKVYKYVLQTTQYKTTALGMYNRLKPKVALETTPDSSFFKIVISLPGTPADTTRIKDSLHFWYWGTRNRPVTIEQ
jgi:hypothetical protein